MSRSQATSSPDRSVCRDRRTSNLLPALLFGLPVSVAVLGYVFRVMPLEAPWQHMVRRYLSHWVEQTALILFCCALGALLAKFWRTWRESAACRATLLPPWDGEAVPVAEAGTLLASLERQPAARRQTWVGCRFASALDFLRCRGSADGLDDQLRSLADTDAMNQENSYGLIRFIAWAIPILGFLGTVLGITDAVAGVTPDKLEQSLSQVTDGLATAFDTTAVALALTMVLMFLSYLTENGEQRVLERVDRRTEAELAHRFERGGPEQNQLVELVRQNSQQLLHMTDQLVQRQAAVWARTLQEVDRTRAEAEQRHQQRLTAALEEVLEKTAETHARRLALLDQQSVAQTGQLLEKLDGLAATVRATDREHRSALEKAASSMARQADVLGKLQEGEAQLLRLQDALNQNLSALAGAGAFEQAVENLTAAIHLMTARVGPATAAPRIVPRPGAAA